MQYFKKFTFWQTFSFVLSIFSLSLVIFSLKLNQQHLQDQQLIQEQKTSLLALAEADEKTLAQNPKLNHLSLSALEAEVASGREIIIYFEHSGCSDCSLFNPRFNTYLTENQVPEIYSVELQTFRDQASDEEWAAFKAKYGFEETPAFVHYQDGKQTSIVQQQSGVQNLTVDLVDAWLKTLP